MGRTIRGIVKIVAISGSLRRRSSNAALIRAAIGVAPDGVTIVIYDRLGELPHFNPDLDGEESEPPPPVSELRAMLIAADAIVISSPEYAHGVPGSLKNMLDWLVSTGELVEKPVALLNAAAAGGQYAQAALVEILRTMNWRVVEKASLLEPFVTRKITGDLEEEGARERLAKAIAALVEDVRSRGRD